MANLERYSRQILIDWIKLEGQEKLLTKKAVIIGCGGLGCIIANNLVRGGVGHIKIIDDGNLELSNLQRQILYDEGDLKNNLPKVEIAKNKLSQINSSIKVEAVNVRVTEENICQLVEGFDIILDGTDNLNTRFIINKASIKLKIPWVLGAVSSEIGIVMNIIPDKTPCFECLSKDTPVARIAPPCEVIGVLNSIVEIVGAYQSNEAFKILIAPELACKELLLINLKENNFEKIKVNKNLNCPICRT